MTHNTETHGIDSMGEAFAYDTQPLPLLNPGLADAAQIATARRLGDGNLSAGVRVALDTLSKPRRDRDQRDQTRKHQ